ncbi:MAG: hypothetical protein ACI9P7_002049 [Candidatus Azotimanducaceae bacterium]
MGIWKKIKPEQTPWQDRAIGRTKHLAPQLTCRELTADLHYDLDAHPGTLLWVDHRELLLDERPTLTTGDLVWIPVDTSKKLATQTTA